MPTKYIDLVGVELEGSWKDTFEDIEIGHDGSVTRVKDFPHFGELVSPPLPLEDILEWTRTHYPQGVNGTCGLHIHVSTKTNELYARLASRKFYNLCLREWERWGKDQAFPETHVFWKRLKGDYTCPEGQYKGVVYAKRDFTPLLQVFQKGKPDSRRTQLNFCHRLHKTIECRLLPTFSDPEVALSAISHFVSIAEGFLEKSCPLPPTKLTFTTIGGQVVRKDY